MKATFARKSLSDAFAMVSSVAPTRSPKPILQNVKLDLGEADGQAFATLSGTDLEVGVRRRVDDVKVDREGSVILPTDRVSQILRTSTDDEISIEVDDGKLVVKGKRSRFSLPSEDPALFPEVPDFDAADYMILFDSDLKKLIRRTAFATDLDSARYALGGTLVERTERTIAFVGTDGRRLARYEVPADRVGDVDDSQAVVPIKALRLLDKALTGDGDQVHIAFDRGKAVLVRTPNAVIYSRLVEGRYPDYKQVFPKSKTYSVALDIATFRSAVEQASIVTSDESRGVTFTFSASGVELTSNAADVGQSKIELPLMASIDGEEMAVTMDPKYVMDCLKSLELDTPLTVDLVDGKNAVLFKSGDFYTYIVMPLSR